MISPEVNTLVIVLPQKGRNGESPEPPVMCWGLIQEITDGNVFLTVRLGKNPNDTTHVRLDQIIPVLHTDGSFSDPQRVFVENEAEIMLQLLLRFLERQGIMPKNRNAHAKPSEPAPNVPPIQENSLVIVLSNAGNPPEACWGLVKKRMLGGNYDVQIGRFRRLKMSKIIVRPDQLIPVYLTDGSFSGPRHAVRTLRAQLFLHIFMMFYSRSCVDVLSQIIGPLSQSDFVLASRRGKRTPPPKKPD